MVMQPLSSHSGRLALGCGLLLTAAALLVFLICTYGSDLPAAAGQVEVIAFARGARGDTALAQVLLALAAVLAVGVVLGRAFAWIGQPPVIGEVVAGIVLGPSFLGASASAWILPSTAAPFLGVIAELGVLLYMFAVGLELHLGRLRERGPATLVIAQASILIPFVLGSALALVLYPRLSSSDVPFPSFALFLGVAMSITAFPVLARVLRDRGMLHSELGVLALSCAAIADAGAWCLLAVVVGIAKAEMRGALAIVGGTAAYVAIMLFAVRPVVARALGRWEEVPLQRHAVAHCLVAVLLSALTTQAIGIHAIFGAFLLGAVIPHDSKIAQAMVQQIEPVVGVLLLPAFFAFTGMRTRIDLVSGVDAWGWCLLIILVATLGKLGGTLVAGLGALMNTRGLMELIVLDIGLDMGIISPTLFAMMVLMALATTMSTAPLLSLLLKEPLHK